MRSDVEVFVRIQGSLLVCVFSFVRLFGSSHILLFYFNVFFLLLVFMTSVFAGIEFLHCSYISGCLVSTKEGN